MNKNIARVGDIVKYNGYMPEHVRSNEKEYIEDSLNIGERYEVGKVHCFDDGIWYRIECDRGDAWVPIESFGSIKINIKEKYGLR